VNSFLWGLLLGGGGGIWLGIKMGGLLAVRRLVEFEYRTLTGRAGLRRK
jgi:hypothetical protein